MRYLSLAKFILICFWLTKRWLVLIYLYLCLKIKDYGDVEILTSK